jgi:hypothetical protein
MKTAIRTFLADFPEKEKLSTSLKPENRLNGRELYPITAQVLHILSTAVREETILRSPWARRSPPVSLWRPGGTLLRPSRLVTRERFATADSPDLGTVKAAGIQR